MDDSWWEHLHWTSPILSEIKAKIASSPICPSGGNTFRAFSLPLPEVKMVILGQDPYPNVKDATGLAFGVDKYRPYKDFPFSLKVIADCFCESEGEADTFFDPALDMWERQGILLLNSSLTCQQGTPGSHSALWKPFMTEVVKLLDSAQPNIFILFGKQAQEFDIFVDKQKHFVLHCPHPAALAYGNNIDKQVYVDTFKIASEEFTKRHGSIDWILPF